MTISDLLPTVQNLNRGDKLRLMQFLIFDIAKEDGVSLPDVNDFLVPNQVYPIWSPFDSGEAANTLLQLLAEDSPAYE